MFALRNKIFIFVAILLILPAIPLSYIISQLLDQSYRIGVNENVEKALDGALKISSDLYNLQKRILTENIEELQNITNLKENLNRIIEKKLPKAKSKILNINQLEFNDEVLISNQALKNFVKKKISISIWPNTNHTELLSVARLQNNNLLLIKYPLPETFQKSAKTIQDVNQMYKTLGFVRNEIQSSFLYVFILIYSVGLLFALAVSFWFSKKITQPVNQLKTAAAEIGRGNFKHRVNINSRDELASLGASFNNMAIELAENQRKIIELEKMNTWQQLARRLAHEIKNPLTPIQLMTQQIRDSYNGEDNQYRNMLLESCQIIEQEVESLKILVQEFSDFARLPKINPVQNSLNDLILSISKLYQSAEISIELPPQNVTINFDYDYLKRVLINLVDNALAANTSNEPILIKLKKISQGNEITVEDKGTGISPENLQRIFEPYYSTKKSGVGLGLSIVKKIIEEHGGKIEVTSELGNGTMFTIFLK